ncbi:hypothetical protein TNCV_3758941 [Trichonephila clavipes]|nr:hypothetical protein TNCV_3758941 [Trichonephila clavipes]
MGDEQKRLPLHRSMVNESFGSCGKPQRPLNMTHPKDAGEFHSPQHHGDMSFLVQKEGGEGLQKDDAREQERVGGR